MNRLTTKNPNGKKLILKNGTVINHFSELTESWMICDKLGKIEDLMEEYKINSIEELENVLASKVIAGGMRSGGKSIVGKGMLYNKLSEGLGCPLPLIFDAIKKGIVVKPYEDEYGDITLWNSRNETELDTSVSKLEFEEPELLFFDSWVFSCSSGCYRGCVKLKDYKKTWWLKGDKDA